jgi:hypothetical protein
MKSSKEELKEAILFFAKQYNEENSYTKLFESGLDLPKLIQIIVYDMFLNKFNSYNCSDIDYNNYKIILEYATELNINGFVKFEEK